MGMFDNYRADFEPVSEATLAEINKKMVSRMGEGIHTVMLEGFEEQKQDDGSTHIFKFSKEDPNWGMIKPTFVNATGEKHTAIMMFPLGKNDATRIMYKGKKNAFMCKNISTICDAIGMEMDKFQTAVVSSEAKALNELVGMTLQLNLQWKKNTSHLRYVSEEKVNYLVDDTNAVISSEPFIVPKEGKFEDKYSEVITAAMGLGKPFNNNIECTISMDDQDNTGYGIRLSEFAKPKAKPTLASFAALKKAPLAKKPDPVVDAE
jgi:hypothetical protein